MDDQDILNIINNQSSQNTEKTCKFNFSLKNKIGGLARALRVFQVNQNKHQNSIFIQLFNYNIYLINLIRKMELM